MNLKDLRDKAMAAITKRIPAEATIESLVFHQAIYPEDVLRLLDVCEASKTFMHYLDIRKDFSQCNSIDHHGMTGRCDCHDKKEVEARGILKESLKSLEAI